MITTENELRIQLAACYRIFDYLGWDNLIYNHITAKVPGERHHFLINPYGLHYSEVKASNLVKVDIDGKVVDDTAYIVNPAGMLIHSAIHNARSDVNCIAHTHTSAGVTVACQQNGLSVDSIYSTLLYNKIAYHDFEGITVLSGEKSRLVSDLAEKNLLILRNHGLLSCGKSIAEAFIYIWTLQQACEIQVAVDATGKPNIPISETIKAKSDELFKIQRAGQKVGELEFNALVRKIEHIDPSYKG